MLLHYLQHTHTQILLQKSVEAKSRGDQWHLRMIDELTNLKGAENMAVLLRNFTSLFLYVAHIWF
jgi:hypothetical protein